MNNLKKDINTAGKVIKKAREELEKELESSIATSENFFDLTENKKKIIETKQLLYYNLYR